MPPAARENMNQTEGRSAVGPGSGRRRGVIGVTAGLVPLVVCVVVVVSLYVASFGPMDVRNVGSDAAAYVVQIRAARLGILDLPSTRPGVGVLGALTTATGVIEPGTAPILLSIAIAACLGLITGMAVRSIYELPGWGVAIVGVVVATWGGTARLTSGYLAQLLSLTLFVLFLILALGAAPGRRRSWPMLVPVAAASLIGHPVLLPAYAAIVVGWTVLLLIRPVTSGTSFGANPALGSFLVAAVGTSILLLLVLEVDVAAIVDFGLISPGFDERTAEIVRWLNPVITGISIVAGAIAAIMLGRTRRAAVAAYLGIAWLAVAGAGLLSPFVPNLPGHRILLLGIPAPMLGGLAIAGGVYVVTRYGRSGRMSRAVSRGLAAAIAGAACASLALAGLAPFEQTIRGEGAGARIGPAEAAGYLLSVGPSRPVVIVADPADPAGSRFLKARQNAVRALAPDQLFLRTVIYLGDERNLLHGLPTRRGSAAGEFDAVSARTWPEVRSVLDEAPIVLVVRHWVRGTTWKRVKDRSLPGAPDIAVLRGPVPSGSLPLAVTPRIPAWEAVIRILSTLLLFGLLGSGWGLVVASRGHSVLDTVALGPAFGLMLIVLIGVFTGMLGADPGGPVGLTLVAVAGALGWVGAWRGWNIGRE